MKHSTVMFVLALSAAVPAGRAAPPAKPALETRETPVTKLIENIADSGLAVSPDARRLAFPAKPAELWAMYIDGEKGPSFHAVTEPLWSPDSRQVFYAGQKKKDGPWSVMLGSREVKEVPQIPLRPFAFSPDSTRTAHIGVRAGKWIITVDGADHTFAAYAPDTLAFSPDSKRVAWVAKPEGKTAFVAHIDGKPVGEECEKATALAWSPDSRRVAFRATRGKTSFVLEPGTAPAERPVFDHLFAEPPVFSQDSRHLAYAGVRGGKWHAVVDGKESRPYETIGRGTVGFAAGKLVYQVQLNKKWRIVEGDAELPQVFETLGLPAFSPDGAHYAIAGKPAGQATWQLIRNGKVEQTFDQINPATMSFSPDSRHLAVGARRGGGMGKAGGGWSVFRDNVPGPVFVALPPVPVSWSPDGQHMAYAAVRPGGKWVLVLDGKESKEYESLLKGPRFAADGSVGALAIVKGTVVRVVAGNP